MEAFQREHERGRLASFLRARCGSLVEAFQLLDEQHDGQLSRAGFRRVLVHLGYIGNAEDAFQALDDQGTGAISMTDFLEALGENPPELCRGTPDQESAEEHGVTPPSPPTNTQASEAWSGFKDTLAALDRSLQAQLPAERGRKLSLTPTTPATPTQVESQLSSTPTPSPSRTKALGAQEEKLDRTLQTELAARFTQEVAFLRHELANETIEQVDVLRTQLRRELAREFSEQLKSMKRELSKEFLQGAAQENTATAKQVADLEAKQQQVTQNLENRVDNVEAACRGVELLAAETAREARSCTESLRELRGKSDIDVEGIIDDRFEAWQTTMETGQSRVLQVAQRSVDMATEAIRRTNEQHVQQDGINQKMLSRIEALIQDRLTKVQADWEEAFEDQRAHSRERAQALSRAISAEVSAALNNEPAVPRSISDAEPNDNTEEAPAVQRISEAIDRQKGTSVNKEVESDIKDLRFKIQKLHSVDIQAAQERLQSLQLQVTSMKSEMRHDSKLDTASVDQVTPKRTGVLDTSIKSLGSAASSTELALVTATPTLPALEAGTGTTAEPASEASSSRPRVVKSGGSCPSSPTSGAEPPPLRRCAPPVERGENNTSPSFCVPPYEPLYKSSSLPALPTSNMVRWTHFTEQSGSDSSAPMYQYQVNCASRTNSVERDNTDASMLIKPYQFTPLLRASDLASRANSVERNRADTSNHQPHTPVQNFGSGFHTSEIVRSVLASVGEALEFHNQGTKKSTEVLRSQAAIVLDLSQALKAASVFPAADKEQQYELVRCCDHLEAKVATAKRHVEESVTLHSSSIENVKKQSLQLRVAADGDNGSVLQTLESLREFADLVAAQADERFRCKEQAMTNTRGILDAIEAVRKAMAKANAPSDMDVRCSRVEERAKELGSKMQEVAHEQRVQLDELSLRLDKMVAKVQGLVSPGAMQKASTSKPGGHSIVINCLAPSAARRSFPMPSSLASTGGSPLPACFSLPQRQRSVSWNKCQHSDQRTSLSAAPATPPAPVYHLSPSMTAQAEPCHTTGVTFVVGANVSGAAKIIPSAFPGGSVATSTTASSNTSKNPSFAAAASGAPAMPGIHVPVEHGAVPRRRNVSAHERRPAAKAKKLAQVGAGVAGPKAFAPLRRTSSGNIPVRRGAK